MAILFYFILGLHLNFLTLHLCVFSLATRVAQNNLLYSRPLSDLTADWLLLSNR